MTRNQGDKEQAIELLKTTNLKYKEIAEITGVPRGTINSLGPIHRSPEIRAANRKRAGIENLISRHETTDEELGGSAYSMIAPMFENSSNITRTVMFSYEAHTEKAISKEEALTEISQLQRLIESATKEQFYVNLDVAIQFNGEDM